MSSYQVPSKSYDLRETSSPIEDIYKATNNFKNISVETERLLVKRLSYRTNTVVLLGTFCAPPKDIADKVNGAGDFFLNKTTITKNH